MIYLVVGATGAGKTTYANSFKKKKNTLVFSIDSWMKVLFWPDMPEIVDDQWFYENHHWYIERINRCEEQIWQVVSQAGDSNCDVVLDLGFATEAHRRKMVERAKTENIPCEIHFLNIDAGTRWARVEQRNRQQAETYVMPVSRGMFDFIESIFEPPRSSAEAKVVEVK